MSKKRNQNTHGHYASGFSKSYGSSYSTGSSRRSSSGNRNRGGKTPVWKELLVILLALIVLAAAIFGLVKLIQNKGVGSNKGSGLKTEAAQTVEVTTANVGTAHALTDEEADMIRNSEKYKNIMANKDQYPEYLIDDLEMNPEICDFVAEYLHMEPAGHGGLTAAEKKASHPLFVQWDKRWGYATYGESCMAISACGPTALSMVAYSLTRNDSIDPYSVAQYAMQNGYYVTNVGTAWTLMTEGAEHYGLSVGTSYRYTEEQMKEILQNGGMIILSVGKGDFTVHSGHFIVLYGYKDGKFQLNDPFSYTNSSKLWTYDQLVNQTKNMWAYFKAGSEPESFSKVTSTTTTTAAATTVSTTGTTAYTTVQTVG